MKAAKPGDIKKSNIKKVLNIFRNSEDITILEISEKTHTSRTTITKIINYLIKVKMVIYAGKRESTWRGGKKPATFKLNRAYGYIIAIQIFRKEIHGIITDFSGNTRNSLIVPFHPYNDTNTIIKIITDMYNRFSGTDECNNNKIIGIGIAFPGIINMSAGLICYSPHFPEWENNYPIVDILKKHIGPDIKIIVDNEARFQAYAEMINGKARGKNNIISLITGTGVAAGVIINRKTYYGSHNLAGEIGHMIINPFDTKKCTCGGSGCFESLVLQHHQIEDIFAKPDNSCEKTIKIREEIINWFAIALYNLIITFDPDIIIIQGSFTKAGKPFLQKIQHRISKQALGNIDKSVKIVYSTYGKDGAVAGITYYMLDKYINETFIS